MLMTENVLGLQNITINVQMEIDPGEISLMSAGACGAFVHGLEDEFMGE